MAVFSGLQGSTALLSFGIGYVTSSWVFGILGYLLLNYGIYRAVMRRTPFSLQGTYTSAAVDPLRYYDLLTLYDFFLIAPILHSSIIPIPLTRVCYRLSGMMLGKNSYPSFAYIGNPFHFVSAGDNVIFGGGAMITPHVFESGGTVTIKPILIGNNVTIGLGSIILPGVSIEDDAVVAAGAVVKKNTQIKKGEVWAGVPARKIR